MILYNNQKREHHQSGLSIPLKFHIIYIVNCYKDYLSVIILTNEIKEINKASSET